MIMVDNQHKKIDGYRDLTEEEIHLMNNIKKMGKDIGGLVDELFEMNGLDKRWLAIGKTDLQTGIMALVRAVAQPTTF
jgi:hypothetical protein